MNKRGRAGLRVVARGRATELDNRPPSDEELIVAFENGDRDFAQLLYDRLIGVVDRTLYRVLGSRGVDHEDLVQTAFEQIVFTLARRRFARACSLSSWALSVTTHVALNALRSRRRERRVFDKQRDAEGASAMMVARENPEHGVATQRTLALLRAHLATMKPEKATTLILHDVLGHELAEIAVLTGVSVAAAQSRLVRARKELRVCLEREQAHAVKREDAS